MPDCVDKKFQEWTAGKDPLEARIAIFEGIRDIPYAIVPDIIDAERYVEILTIGKGSCTPKHFLLRDMYQRLDVPILYVVYPFRWDEVEIDYPRSLLKLAREMPESNHLACMLETDRGLVLVDATLDPALKAVGLPVNEGWDGASSTSLPMNPRGEGRIYHPCEAYLMQPQRDRKSLAFYDELNYWLDSVRRSQS